MPPPSTMAASYTTSGRIVERTPASAIRVSSFATGSTENR